jgi:Kef-type K+ transport system membrane component KefB
MLTKVAAVYPASRFFRFSQRESAYISAMMSTGLTFGTISSLYGLTHHLISQTQYTVLVTVVILSAVVPTLIAQALFHPHHLVSRSAVEIPEAVLAPGVT